MDFTQEDFKNLLIKISKNEEKLNQFIQGWDNFKNEIKQEIKNCVNLSNNQSYKLTYEGVEDMKGITLRKDGRYSIRKTIDGKNYIKYARTLAEAKKIYTKLKKVRYYEDPTKTDFTLEKWNKYWLETFKKPFILQKSYHDIELIINKINEKLGKIKLDKLQAIKIQKFLNEFSKGRTKERIQTYFNATLQKATDLGIIKINPFKAIVKEKKGKYKNYCFSYEEQKAILTELDNTNIKQEILIYLMTGCRPNELPKNENFNFAANLITINGTKNENAKHRVVEMSKNFTEYIKPYILAGCRLKVKDISEDFKSVCKKLNIKKPLLYRLRHTFASNHFILQTPIKLIQEWLGHSTISLTLDIYTDYDKTASKEKIKDLYNNFYYIANSN